MRVAIWVRVWGMLFACIVGGAVLCAQQPAQVQKEDGVYTIHANTHMVLLDVTVTDKQGHPVAGLTKDDFKLTEDGQPQTIKFFEEHAPVYAAEIARQKIAALAGQPPNTFTNYEPFSGRPVTVLVLNELFTLPMYDLIPLHRQMLNAVRNAPPDTPFVLYKLDSELRLVQPVTTDHALLLAKINEIWMTVDFGSERLINPMEYAAHPERYKASPLELRRPPSADNLRNPIASYSGPNVPFPAEDIPVRRRITSDAMRQLVASVKVEPGKKDLFFFTGGFQCSVVAPGSDGPGCPSLPFPNDRGDYLCGLMDTLEQGRMSIYRYYPRSIGYGFGCPASVDLGNGANYYTLYYTPTDGEWNGKYRATNVEVMGKGLHLAYRKGYYATPENVEAHYYTAKGHATEQVAPSVGGPAITARTVAAGTADSEGVDAGSAAALPSPASAVFTVQVVPAETTVVPEFVARVNDKTTKKEIEKQKQDWELEHEYRQYTLRFSMPASEFKVTQSGAGEYLARLEIGAVTYGDSWSPETYRSQVAANFDGVADPRIVNSTIAATLKVNVPEHGKDRWISVSVRDSVTGQMGSMVIPMGQVKMPGVE